MNQNRNTQEIRPIIGWHLGSYDLIINPILDNSYKYLGKIWSIEGGIGVGLTNAGDRLVIKLILSRDL